MIITNDEEKLRLKCEDVLQEEVAELVDLLENELKNSARLGRPGIGLAAPQIGIAKKIAIVRSDNDTKFNINLVNCYIEKAYDKAIFKDEGCLSFPGLVGDTQRYQEIYVKNNLVYPHSFVANGILAVVCQHELDHINGILLPDILLKKQAMIKAKPNDPCICGAIDINTGRVKKFKKCCGR